MLHKVHLKSSVLNHTVYDDVAKTMIINMIDRQGNKLGFKYYEVPKDIFDGLVKAPSAGKFHNEKIRNQFNFDKL